MIVCSNRGPTIAFARGCWLLLHIVARFGACITLFSSPSSGSSTNGWSDAPVEEEGSTLVPDTLKAFSETLGFGLLAGTGLSVVVL
jgi:hypothetical protein